MLVEDFISAFRRDFPDLGGRRLLLALSGGSDSVALLHLVRASSSSLGIEPVAAHVHHHIRGAEADRDAAFCDALCARLGVQLRIAHLDPAIPRGESPEGWWRHERYRILAQLRGATGSAATATAHTADDQAETVLLKLLRGSGPRAVAGIRRRRGTVIRPLLLFERDELRSWLSDRGETWRDDSSNADLERPRAWVRHRVLPLLRSRFSGTSRHLASFANAVGESERFIGDELRRRAAWPDVGQDVALAPVARLERPLRVRWVLELAASLPLAEPPSRAQLAAAERLLDGGEPAAVDLGRRWVLRRRGDRLALSPPPLAPFPPVPADTVTELPGGFVGRLGSPGSSHRAWLAPRFRRASLAWRSRRPGERLEGRRVTAALANAGVPREWRAAWPVLEADGRMVWVPAVGVVPGSGGEAGKGLAVGLEEPWPRFVRS